jgi:hypothetical protein
MDALAVPLAFFVAAAADRFPKRSAFWLVILLAAGGIVAAATSIVKDAWWDDQDAAYLLRGIQAGHGYDGMDEYAPLGVSHWDLPGEPPTDDKEAAPPPETPRVEELDEDSGDVVPVTNVTINYKTWSVERRVFSVKTDDPVSLVPRLVNYPAWDVRIDGKKIQPGYVDLTGQMILPVPAGDHLIDVRFRRTWDRTLGGIISLLALISLLFFRRLRSLSTEHIE